MYFLTLWAWGCPASEALRILGGTLFACFSIATVLGALSFNREIFWGSIRVGLLPNLWTPLGIILILTSIPWWLILTAWAFWISVKWSARMSISGPADSVAWKLLFGDDSDDPFNARVYGGASGIVGIPLAVGVVLLGLGLYLAWQKFYEKSPLRGVTKVLGDIFLYLGVPEYRTQLVTASAKKIEELFSGGVNEIVICAHSLGTVISADALCAIPETKAPKAIIFISAGSPLHRMFWRFFPALFPPPHEIATTLGHKHHGFRWVNVHRKLDYVGGSLRLGANGIDICTGQWWPMHVNYWADFSPIKRVIDALKTTPTFPATDMILTRHQPIQNSRSASLQAAKRRMGFIILIALVMSFPVKRAIGEYRRIATKKAEIAEYLAAGDKRATKIKVRFYTRETVTVMGIGVTNQLNILIKNRGLMNDLPNDYLLDTIALQKKMKELGLMRKFPTETPRISFYELEMDGTEVASNPHLFTIAELPLPKMSKKQQREFQLWGLELVVYVFVAAVLWPLLRWFTRFFLASDSETKA